MSLADNYSYAAAPRPWKNPYFKPSWAATGSGGKRNKPLKQVLVLERERVDKLQRERRETVERLRAEGQTVPSALCTEIVSCTSQYAAVDARRMPIADLTANNTVASSVEAPPSIIPPKKYCDVTGLEVRCTDLLISFNC